MEVSWVCARGAEEVIWVHAGGPVEVTWMCVRGPLEVMPVSVRGAMEVSALACTCVHRNASKTFAGNHSKHISVYLCVSQSF